MLVMKTTSAIYIILVLQTTVALAVSLSMYKSCLFECLHCVDTWGKDLFNGEACADSCAMSAGESIDRTCTSYFTRSVRRAGRNRQMSAAYADDSGSSSAESGYSRYGYNIRGIGVPVPDTAQMDLVYSNATVCAQSPARKLNKQKERLKD
nr:hypothetical protein BaRGS_007382 [Batillaria attramentaria]